MGLFDKIFGKPPVAASRQASPSPSDGKPLGQELDDLAGSLQVVFSAPRSYTAATLQSSLGKLLPSKKVRAEAMEGSYEKGTPVTRITWDDRVVDIVGFDVPMPAQSVEECVQAAHYQQAVKARVRAQQAHAILYSSGPGDVLERYVASAVVGAAFATLGGSAVLNGDALTSLPASVVHELATAKPNLEVLCHLPILMLYCGFVKYEIAGHEGVFMRTYNCPAFGLPDLAMRRSSHAKATETMSIFEDLLGYLKDSGKQFRPGHTAHLGERNFRFRAPRDDEAFPTHTAGQLLILEPAS